MDKRFHNSGRFHVRLNRANDFGDDLSPIPFDYRSSLEQGCVTNQPISPVATQRYATYDHEPLRGAQRCLGSPTMRYRKLVKYCSK